MLSLLASTILIVGDSHTAGPFGQKLDELLREKGARVATYASCGSIARWWYTGQKTNCGYFERDLSGAMIQTNSHATPEFPGLLRDVSPDQVIIALATNYVREADDEVVIRDLTRLMDDIRFSRAGCLWILPPDMRKFRSDLPRLNRLVKRVAGQECEYFESAAYTRYPESGGDGIHYWSSEAVPVAHAWAAAVVSAIRVNFTR